MAEAARRAAREFAAICERQRALLASEAGALEQGSSLQPCAAPPPGCCAATHAVYASAFPSSHIRVIHTLQGHIRAGVLRARFPG